MEKFCLAFGEPQPASALVGWPGCILVVATASHIYIFLVQKLFVLHFNPHSQIYKYPPSKLSKLLDNEDSDEEWSEPNS
jgi:hypothetical protein